MFPCLSLEVQILSALQGPFQGITVPALCMIEVYIEIALSRVIIRDSISFVMSSKIFWAPYIPIASENIVSLELPIAIYFLDLFLFMVNHIRSYLKFNY